MTRHDVAIYTPLAAGVYSREGRAPGGAERQMAILARALAGAGLRVAHIVLPLTDPTVPGDLTVLQREPDAGGRRPFDKVVELRRTWRALAAADARLYIIRGASPVVGVLALFCLLHRRRLLFSSANDFDFTLEGRFDGRVDLGSYRLGLRMSHAVVVQTSTQLELAGRAVPRPRRTVAIPSFAEPAEVSPSAPEAFLWMGRLVDYKQPLRYLDLAEAVPEARFWMIAVETNETDAALTAEVHRRARELPNLAMLPPRSHQTAMELVAQAIASVSTSRLEGMPNVFLEAWTRGIPVLSLSFDPDGRIAEHGLGVAAGDSWERFVSGTRELWSERGDREITTGRVREYVARVHSPLAVSARWVDLCRELAPRAASGAAHQRAKS